MIIIRPLKQTIKWRSICKNRSRHAIYKINQGFKSVILKPEWCFTLPKKSKSCFHNMPMTMFYYVILFMSVRTNQTMMNTNGLKEIGQFAVFTTSISLNRFYF
jgi:hypothetical protein